MKTEVQNLEIYLCFACEMNRASASSWQRAGLGNLPEGGCEGERGERGEVGETAANPGTPQLSQTLYTALS